MSNSSNKNQNGFTLIEIMIAMAIMSSLTIFTAQSIRSALQSSRKYRQRIANTSELRDVLRVMERDINLAFHHRNVQQDVLNQIQKDKEQSNSSDTTESDSEKKEVENFTRFSGKGGSLHFTSLSHTRTMVDNQDSDQAELSYFTKDCRSRNSTKRSSKCLWRRVSTTIDDDIEKGGNSIVLIENVKEFSLRYIGPARKDETKAKWINRWESGENGTEQTKDKFPSAVEVKLVINRFKGDKTIEQEMIMIAALRFPNNEEEKDETENTNSTENNNSNDTTKQ